MDSNKNTAHTWRKITTNSFCKKMRKTEIYGLVLYTLPNQVVD